MDLDRASPRPPADRRPTRERLLDAAEELFAERGFAGTSIRAVTQTVGVSVSAANYHFGSKEDLLHATLRRRAEPVNQSRIAQLERAEAEAGPAGPELEAIVDAYLRPAFSYEVVPPEPRRQLLARLFSDPPEIVAALRRDLLGEVTQRFVDALERVLPGRPRAEIALGLEFAVGVMVHLVGQQHSLVPDASDGTPFFSSAEIADRMIAFAASGLRASVAHAAD